MSEETHRLYWDDPELAEFDARVIAARETEKGGEVVLDRTAFYPDAGGQPHDIGRLADSLVLGVEERGAEIVHVIRGALPGVGEEIHGIVDIERRRDHSTQHTAQHIISAIALAELGAATVGFHLGDRSSSVDLELAELDDAGLERLEYRSNRIALEDRPVTTRLTDDPEGLRKRGLADHDGPIRVVDIEGLDCTGCCGTHLRRTGQAGLIKLARRERVRSAVRVEFWAGLRALERFRWLSSIAAGLGEITSAGPGELVSWAEAARAESKRLKGELRALGAELAASEAIALVAGAAEVAAGRLIRKLYVERDPRLVRDIALHACREPGVVALLGTTWEGAARLVFARSEELSLNMNEPLGAALAVLGGKGGGRPELVQSGGGDPERLGEALEAAEGAMEGER